MSPQLPHVIWLKKKVKRLTSQCNREISVYELKFDFNDTAALNAWAKHFREHYCLDSKIDKMRRGTNLSRAEYLTQLVFPDITQDFGPATRSGDFAEILVSDLLEGLLNYWVPRTRYISKMVRNESPKGTDVIGFKIVSTDLDAPSKKDILISFESKAQFSGKKAKPRLQDAIVDSKKDKFRIAESLNAIKQRLDDQGKEEDVLKVERFQDPLGRPYKLKTGAAALFCKAVFDPAQITSSTDASGHDNADNLSLIVIHGVEMMKFVHLLYERAASEA
ncbi:Hachiman antiphage defense system protein HamA [Massilia brevitalea]|uniref:Hachiman antiphage defense system protein HamA n=1 Tax=Massilia brevitalea TaxID=442526 RepID=UPI0027386BFC|nr:Hachiman antiphage defense system protein HamA [Massilia brevitalea]